MLSDEKMSTKTKDAGEYTKTINNKRVYEARKAIIKDNENILLVRLNPELPFLEGEWEVPGGRIHAGETEDVALKREVREEVGIEIIIKEKINDWKLDLPDFSLHGKSFLCESLSTRVVLDDPERQHIDFRWVTIKEALKYNIPNWLRKGLEIIRDTPESS